MSEDQARRTEALLERLTGKGEKELRHLLRPGSVAVTLGTEAAREAQAQLLFSFAINLLARLSPVVQDLQIILPADPPIVCRLPRWEAPTLAGHIRAMLGAIDPPLAWGVRHSPRPGHHCYLSVGAPLPSSETTIYVGSEGWEAFLSPLSPVQSSGNANPVGAYAAACLGVGEVWKRLLFPHRGLFIGRPIVPLEHDLKFSTLTYKADHAASTNPPLEIPLDLGRVTMVGLGAGGGAAAFTLASLGNVRGYLNLVDPDDIDLPNLNRYVFADARDAGAAIRKTELIRQILSRFSGLEVRSYPEPFTEIVATLSPEDFRHVVAAVHSRDARRELQYETPLVMWDGGATEDGEFRVWRLVFGETECMHCKHPPSESDPETEKARQLTELLGLDQATWARKARNNEAFTEEEIVTLQLCHSGTEPYELPRVSQRFGDWEVRQCGRLPLPELDAEIPIPFAPVMAGVLLAGEMIKEKQFPEYVLRSVYWNTLMGSFMRRNRPSVRPPRENCSFCSDRDYLAQFRRRWSL